jgi:hypothetical protein
MGQSEEFCAPDIQPLKQVQQQFLSLYVVNDEIMHENEGLQRR